MNYNLAICDDDISARLHIRLLVDKWARLRQLDVKTNEYESAEAFLFSGYESADILILDIEMGGISGIDLAKELRKRKSPVQILFITGYLEYISDGYEVAALHYLLKPVNPEKLFMTLDRAAENIARDQRTLAIETTDGVARVSLREIRYVDIHGNYATVHADEDYTVRKTLNDLTALLDKRFYRLGRSVIVNLEYIKRVSRDKVILSDGAALSLPRGAYEHLNRAIIDMR